MIVQNLKGNPTPKDIAKAVEEYANLWIPRIRRLESAYRSSSGETYSNKYKNGLNTVTERMLNFPIAQYITNITANYVLGNAPQYTFFDEDRERTDSEKECLYEIKKLYRKQSKLRLDKNLKLQCGKTGFAYELVWLDKESLTPKSKQLDVLSTFVVFDSSEEGDSVYAVTMTQTDNLYTVYIYTDESVITYLTKNPQDAAGYVLRETNPHYCGRVPITMYRNNPALLGDYENVETLICAFNDIMTDAKFDIKRTVDGILVFYNTRLAGADAKMKAEVRDAMRTLGILELNDDPDNPTAKADVKSLNNALNLVGLETFLDRIWKAIFKLSMVPDPLTSEFYTALSGVAIKMQMFLGLEPAAKNTEGEFEYALKRRLKIYRQIMNLRDKVSEIDVGDVQIRFNRSLPMNDLETAQMISLLYGKDVASAITLSKQLSFVSDADKEVESAKAENISAGTDELIRQLSSFGSGSA